MCVREVENGNLPRRLARLDKTDGATYTAVNMKGEARDIMIQSTDGLRPGRFRLLPLTALAILTLPTHAHASLFHGETLDSIANGISWVVIVIAPIIGIAIFWLVHILPEKIAEKK